MFIQRRLLVLNEEVPTIRMGDIPKLRGKLLEQYLRNPKYKKLILNYAANAGSGDWGGLRNLIDQLLNFTTSGGLLAEYHPGTVTVYRGMAKAGISRKISSWSADPKSARMYGKHIETRKINPAVPALDLDKIIGEPGTLKEIMLRT